MSYSKLLRRMSRAASFTLLVIVLIVWNPSVISTQGPLSQKNEPSPPAALEVAGFDPVSPAFTQTLSPVTVRGVFDPDLADLKTKPLKDAIDAATAQAPCYPPRVTFKVLIYSGSDPGFDAALANARKGELIAGLPSLGLQPGQYNPKVEIGPAPPGSHDLGEVQLNFDKFNDQDKDPPKLIKVTWTPPNGDTVKAGDQINVTITASERYEDGHQSWPTGVQSLQLLAKGGGGKPDGFWKPPEPCERRTMAATYTVPPNPPSVVELKAYAEDGVGHNDYQLAKFYTVPEGKNNVIPANCKRKGSARLGFIDISPLLGAFDKQSPNFEMDSCNFRWSICGTPYIKTQVSKNGKECSSFFTSAEAGLPKEQYCCDCYPKCGGQRKPNK